MPDINIVDTVSNNALLFQRQLIREDFIVNFGYIAIMMVALSAVLFHQAYVNHELEQRLVNLENQPALELTCAIPDRKGRYVCRYVEVVR